MQANNKVWTENLAKKCLSSGLGLVTCAWGQPPLRPNPLRVMHRFNKIKGRTCLNDKCK